MFRVDELEFITDDGSVFGPVGGGGGVPFVSAHAGDILLIFVFNIIFSNITFQIAICLTSLAVLELDLTVFHYTGSALDLYKSNIMQAFMTNDCKIIRTQ